MADSPVGVAGNRCMFNAFVLETGDPALLRKDAMGALGGQLAFYKVR